eukprot:342338-Amorphochlora_amoeboformis.AAC.1
METSLVHTSTSENHWNSSMASLCSFDADSVDIESLKSTKKESESLRDQWKDHAEEHKMRDTETGIPKL